METHPQISLAFVGDVFPGSEEASVSSPVSEALTDCDAVIINLEAPLTDAGTELPGKSLHLRSRPEHLAVVKALSTSVACLANNHMCDWGPVGVTDTRQLLEQGGFCITGAGRNIDEASAPAVIERNGVSIGVIALGTESIGTHPASQDGFGCNIFKLESACLAIRKLSAETNIVVVSVHWGYTNYHQPLPEHIHAARKMIEAGAAIVAGHHPHVIQGFERYLDGVIIYSLGNFIFGRFHRKGRVVNQSRENQSGLICKVHLERQRVSRLEFIHTEQKPTVVSVDLMDVSRTKQRAKLMDKLSRPLSLKNYEGAFRRYVARRMAYRTLRWCNPKMWRNIDRAYLQGVVNAMQLLKKRGT